MFLYDALFPIYEQKLPKLYLLPFTVAPPLDARTFIEYTTWAQVSEVIAYHPTHTLYTPFWSVYCLDYLFKQSWNCQNQKKQF